MHPSPGARCDPIRPLTRQWAAPAIAADSLIAPPRHLPMIAADTTAGRAGASARAGSSASVSSSLGQAN